MNNCYTCRVATPLLKLYINAEPVRLCGPCYRDYIRNNCVITAPENYARQMRTRNVEQRPRRMKDQTSKFAGEMRLIEEAQLAN